MQRDEILRKLEEIVPSIQASSDAEGTLLKFASDHNLSPAQLEAVAQVYNTGRALTFYSKSASRGATFRLVNTEPLLDRYTDHCKKAGLEPSGLAKAASTGIVEGGRFPHYRQITGGYETLEKVASVKDEVDTWCREKLAQMRKSDMSRQAVQTAEEIKSASMDDIRVRLDELKQEVRFNKQAFFELEEDAHDMWKAGSWKSTFNTISGYLKSVNCDVDSFRYEESKKASRAVAIDRTGLLKLAEEIKDNLELIKASNDFIEEIKSAAKDLNDPPKDKDKKKEEKKKSPVDPALPSGGAPTGSGAPAVPPETPDFNGPPLEDFPEVEYSAPEVQKSKDAPILKGFMEGFDSSKMKAPSLKSPLNAGRDVITSVYDGKNRRQQKRDEAVEQDNTTAALQRLMVTDPILAEASPEDVIQHFNTIHEIAPSLSTDPQKLKLVLREAVSYGSIPMHTLKELLEIEKLVLSNSQLAGKNQSDAYGPSGIFKRPSKSNA